MNNRLRKIWPKGLDHPGHQLLHRFRLLQAHRVHEQPEDRAQGESDQHLQVQRQSALAGGFGEGVHAGASRRPGIGRG
jgi:hypothetical protein